MIRKIKLSTGTTMTFEDKNKKIYESVDAWKAEGEKRFGPEIKKWKYVCPMCGHVASVQDFIDVGVKEAANCACVECIGRYLGKGSHKDGDSSGCNWTAYGLFGIPNNNGVIVITGNNTGSEAFAFAEDEKSMFKHKETNRKEGANDSK